MYTTRKIKGMLAVSMGLAFFGLALFLTVMPTEAAEIPPEARANQISLAGEMMAQMAFDTLEGKSTEVIPVELFDLLRSARAFETEQNFRLAMSLIAAETGMPMTEILPPALDVIKTGGTRSGAGVSTGWGGFFEYGLGAILSFLFVGYLMARNAFDVHHPEEIQETAWAYQRAA